MGTPKKKSTETFVKDIRKNTRRIFTAEQKILIVMEGLRAETSVAELCRKHSIAQSQFYAWNKEFMEAGKKRLNGDVELEIETLEGLANYTGFVLSTHENKYDKAISEINQREEAETYTRPFPYATGPAYGLIFDYLKINWKNGLDKVYNFAEIYETKVSKSKLKISKKALDQAKAKNNFEEINKQETAREERQNKLISYYTDLLINKPILKVAITDFDNYGRSYNMNGTLTLKDKGIIYSSIRGRDKSNGKNFGNFSTIDGKDELGKAGILSYIENETTYFVFPLPVEITETKIIGEFYQIELNPNWKVIKKNDGNMDIVKE